MVEQTNTTERLLFDRTAVTASHCHSESSQTGSKDDLFNPVTAEKSTVSRTQGLKNHRGVVMITGNARLVRMAQNRRRKDQFMA
jgi:hypothetical protein